MSDQLCFLMNGVQNCLAISNAIGDDLRERSDKLLARDCLINCVERSTFRFSPEEPTDGPHKPGMTSAVSFSQLKLVVSWRTPCHVKESVIGPAVGSTRRYNETSEAKRCVLAVGF